MDDGTFKRVYISYDINGDDVTIKGGSTNYALELQKVSKFLTDKNILKKDEIVWVWFSKKWH